MSRCSSGQFVRWRLARLLWRPGRGGEETRPTSTAPSSSCSTSSAFSPSSYPIWRKRRYVKLASTFFYSKILKMERSPVRQFSAVKGLACWALCPFRWGLCHCLASHFCSLHGLWGWSETANSLNGQRLNGKGLDSIAVSVFVVILVIWWWDEQAFLKRQASKKW